MNKRLAHIIASRHILTALMSLFLLSAVSSCSKDENPEVGKATVKMTFSTRAGAQTGSTFALEARERMQTLRVIMENANTGEILYNVFYNNLQGGEKKVIFQDVPVEEEEGTDFNFYAIANESSFLTEGESLAGKDVDLEALYKREIQIDFNNNELPLPQAKKNQKKIMPVKGTQEHTVKLEYPVAKIGVVFTNEIETEQIVTDIRIPNLKVNSGKLFPQDFDSSDSAPQAGTDAADISFSPSPLNVQAGTFGGNPGKASVTSLYVYPAAGSSYTLNANWPDNNAKEIDLNQSGKLAEGICRGMQLNVGVTLKYGVMQLNNLTVTVENWNNVFVIPEFQ